MKKLLKNDFLVGILMALLSFFATAISMGIIVPFTAGYGYYRSRQALKSGKVLALIGMILNGFLFILILIILLGSLIIMIRLKK